MAERTSLEDDTDISDTAEDITALENSGEELKRQLVDNGHLAPEVMALRRDANEETMLEAARRESKRVDDGVNPTTMVRSLKAILKGNPFVSSYIKPTTVKTFGVTPNSKNFNPYNIKDGNFGNPEDGIRRGHSALVKSFKDGARIEESESFLSSLIIPLLKEGAPQGWLIPKKGNSSPEDREKFADAGGITVNLDLNSAGRKFVTGTTPYVVYSNGPNNSHPVSTESKAALLKVAEGFRKLYEAATGLLPTKYKAFVLDREENLGTDDKPRGKTFVAHLELMNINDETPVTIDGVTMSVVDYFFKHPKGMAAYAKLLRDNLSDSTKFKIQLPHGDSPSGGASRRRKTVREVLTEFKGKTNDPKADSGWLKRAAAAAKIELDVPLPAEWSSLLTETDAKYPKFIALIKKVGSVVTTAAMNRGDAALYARRMEDALNGATNQPLPLTGNLNNTIGHGTRLDWPVAKDQLLALGINAKQEITPKQAEQLAQTRMAFIGTMLNKTFDGVSFEPYQYNALLQAVYTSPWLKSADKSDPGRPEVLTKALIDAVYNENWKVVQREIARATRVPQPGAPDGQKKDEKDRIKLMRKAQAALFGGVID